MIPNRLIGHEFSEVRKRRALGFATAYSAALHVNSLCVAVLCAAQWVHC